MKNLKSLESKLFRKDSSIELIKNLDQINGGGRTTIDCCTFSNDNCYSSQNTSCDLGLKDDAGGVQMEDCHPGGSTGGFGGGSGGSGGGGGGSSFWTSRVFQHTR